MQVFMQASTRGSIGPLCGLTRTAARASARFRPGRRPRLTDFIPFARRAYLPGAKISALGCYVPPGVLTNQDLEKMVDTTDQWILERTGISERHIAAPDVATSDMAVEAARCVLLQRGIGATEVEAIIVCTVTPDMMFPSTACLVQDRIGAKGAWGFDLVAACSGFLYGLTTAANLVIAGAHKK